MIRIHRFPHEEPTINLTPLIDVVFVILIMFILIAPLLEFDQIDLAQASSAKQENISVQKNSPITIQVRKDNALVLNNKVVTLALLKDLLIKQKKAHPKAIPQIFQDKKAFFGTYQEVKNAVEEAGFDQMDLVLNPL